MKRSRFLTVTGAGLAASVSGCAATPPAMPPVAETVGFNAALQRLHGIIAAAAADESLERQAIPRLYHHGHPTQRSVVLFHGFTNCPQQFDELARRFFARGCNVYVPLIPGHGKKDRLTRDLSQLSVAELERCARDGYQLASGLGARVTALGLSLGGTMAMWLAQTQPVDRAVPVAPFFMPIHFPPGLGSLAVQTAYALPDRYFWWDPRVKTGARPPYAYPGFTTHSLAECVFFGGAVTALAAADKPRGRRCTLVTNANESAVNDAFPRHVLDLWKQHGSKPEAVVLRGLGAPRHDIIDPTTFPQARTLVYPRLLELGS